MCGWVGGLMKHSNGADLFRVSSFKQSVKVAVQVLFVW